MSKPRRANLLAEIFTGRHSKIDIPQLIAIAPLPATMVPGADDDVVQMILVGFLKHFIGFQGTVEVFLIPPTTNVHRGYPQWLQLIGERLALPKRIVVRVIDKVVPGRQFAMKMFCVGV